VRRVSGGPLAAIAPIAYLSWHLSVFRPICRQTYLSCDLWFLGWVGSWGPSVPSQKLLAV